MTNKVISLGEGITLSGDARLQADVQLRSPHLESLGAAGVPPPPLFAADPGALESLVCILAIRDGVVPPTINYEHPDPECDLDYVPNTARRVPVRTAVTNSFGFGGHNVSLVFRAV